MIANLFVDNRLWKTMEVRDPRRTFCLAVPQEVRGVNPSNFPEVGERENVEPFYRLVFERFATDKSRGIVRYKFTGVSH